MHRLDTVHFSPDRAWFCPTGFLKDVPYNTCHSGNVGESSDLLFPEAVFPLKAEDNTEPCLSVGLPYDYRGPQNGRQRPF